MLKFHCRCGKKLGVLDDWEGKWVTCPACRNSVRVRRDGGAVRQAVSADTAASSPAASPAASRAPIPLAWFPKSSRPPA